MTGGVVLINDDVSLPGDESIAWRETTKKSLGTFRYLFRILTALEVPLLFILVASANGGVNSDSRMSTASSLLYVTWIICSILVSVKAATLISSERMRETLDVLLTVPMSGRQILLEKFRGARRLAFVLGIPLATIHFFEAIWRHDAAQVVADDAGWYLASGILGIAIYLPLCGWLAFWIGLNIRSQTRAIVVCLVVVLGWIYTPLLFPAFSWLSPARLMIQNETTSPINPVWNSINFSLYAVVLYAIRQVCLTRADHYLGRNSEDLSLTDLSASLSGNQTRS